MSSDEQSRRGLGAFVFVVGPSGAGKDTLIEGARAELVGNDRFCFIRRSVTRPVGKWESHENLSRDQFEIAARDGAFAMTWEAHGLMYGVPSESVDLVRQGRVVICNGSRAAIGRALEVFGQLKLVLVTAPPAILAARLETRGREEETRGRLERLADAEFGQMADLVLVNDGSKQAGTQKLLEFLLNLT